MATRQIDERCAYRDNQAQAKLFQRLGVEQARQGAEDDADGSQQDHSALEAAGEIFHLGVAKCEFVIRRLAGHPQGEQSYNR